jgi:hypothetical protein
MNQKKSNVVLYLPVVVAVIIILVTDVTYTIPSVNGFVVPMTGCRTPSASTSASAPPSPLYSMPTEQQQQQQQQQDLSFEDDPDAPAGIGGAEFFGGNKQKEEFYDPIAEENIGLLNKLSDGTDGKTEYYHRFFATNTNDAAAGAASTHPTDAFETVFVASVAQSLQRQIQRVLYEDDKILRSSDGNDGKNDDDTTRPLFSYSSSSVDKPLNWETPFLSSTPPSDEFKTQTWNPIDQLRSSKEFYKKLDVAIVGGRELNGLSSSPTSGVSKVELFWEISVIWPTFWAPRVLLTGSSTLHVQVDDGLIVGQVDRLSMGEGKSSSLVSVLAKQITPRFWDWYHIGMTPPAEQIPKMAPTKESNKKGLFANYNVYNLPGRLMTVPTLIETGTRENRHAETVPDHAFACYIKTMGPSKQLYVPTTPVEVQIGRETNSDNRNRLQLTWSIPLSVEFQARNEIIPLPGKNPEAIEGSDPKCSYRWEPPRTVATIYYGGNVQDEEITDLRKHLYEQVTKDGWQPKLDENGRPRFFFWQNDVKACFTEEGLGMCVYEWRPRFAKSNEVGIELEPDVQALSKKM